MVYPNATHTRFAHALGVMHLMSEALRTLSQKRKIDLPPQTHESALLAALLHDVGHAPFSHSLEGLILKENHETIGRYLIAKLEADLGDLSEVRALLSGNHPMPFLSQLLQGPLDVDRLDYLVRDSFFTGVQEGIIGTQRLIYTLTCGPNKELAIEEKGLASVEKFLLARRFMYWQVYLHKTVIAAETLLRRWWMAFVTRPHAERDVLLAQIAGDWLQWVWLDEPLVWSWIRQSAQSGALPERLLAKALLARRLYKIQWGEPPLNGRLAWEHTLPKELRPYHELFWTEGTAHSTTYEPDNGPEILIQLKNGALSHLSQMAPWLSTAGPIIRPYWGYLSAKTLATLEPLT